MRPQLPTPNVVFVFHEAAAVRMYLLFTSLVLAVLATCIPFMGNDPSNCDGRGITAVLHLAREAWKIWRSLIFAWSFLVLTARFHCMSAGRYSDSTPDSRRVPLRVPDYRAFRTVQAALQTTTAVVSSREFVSCGNGGTLIFVWISAAMLPQFAR